MSNKSPVWNGPSALVPLPTDILLIGQGDVNADSDWADLKNNYSNMYLNFVTAQPKPFVDVKCPPVGAHLMWTLPNGLRQGKQQSTEGAPVDFPNAPNRWLVTRFAIDSDTNTLTSTPTVVVSDVLLDTDGNLEQINQYPYYQDTVTGVRQIGTNVPLDKFSGENNSDVDVKAVGPGDVSWSFAYDNIRNVFSLHDDLPDKSQTYLYSVVGWYADPTSDPLFPLPTSSGKDWLSLLQQQFGWTCEDLDKAQSDWLTWQKLFGVEGDWDPDALQLPAQAKAMIESWHAWQQANGTTTTPPAWPTQSVYHSMVATVQWKGKNTSYGTGAPIGGDGRPKLPTIAIANTPESVISTYMATKASETPGTGITKQDIPDLSITLESFQRGLLFDLQTDPKWAQSMIHNAKFDKKYRGQEWIVVRSQKSSQYDTSEPNQSGQQSVPLDASQTQQLSALNQLQFTLNTLNLAMHTRKVELYALATKNAYLKYNPVKGLNDTVTKSVQAITSELTKNNQQLTQLQTDIDTAAGTLTTALGDNYELKAVDLDPIAAPADPVVLFSGSEVDTKILPTEYNGLDEKLPVRFTGQTITAISVTDPSVQVQAIIIDWEDILNKITLPTWNATPKEVLNLWLEALLLDTSFAPLIADIYFTKAGATPTSEQRQALIAKIQKQQTAPWSDLKVQIPTEALSQACLFQGLLPDHIGVAFRQNTNPWTPIYMDWEIRWIPSSPDLAKSLSDWNLGDNDYQWKGSDINSAASLRLQGRSLLNLKTTYNMQAKFETFKDDKNYSNLPENTVKNLTTVANNVKYLDLVTQSMSGMTQQLNTMLIEMLNTPENADIKALLNNSSYYSPNSGDTNDKQGLTDYPIRAGHFQVMNLRLVDSFGQVLPAKSNLLGPNDPINNIIWSHSLATSSPNFSGDTSTYGQLPPRISQDAMMFTRLLQHNDDSIFTNSSDSTSPICGWVMPNHLDDSLMVFDAEGENLGAVIKVRREVAADENTLTIRWDAAPGTNSQLGAAPNIDNEHLSKFINNLLNTGVSDSGAQAYSDFMDHIDSSLWLNNILKKNQGNLSVLLGRPLAIVRTEVKLDLAGEPAYNQSWFKTGEYYNDNGTYKAEDPPFVSVKFNVRIGDSQFKNNGVMGYFASDDYTHFNAVYGNVGQTSALQRQLKERTDGRTMEQMKSAISAAAPSAKGYVVTDHLVALAANQDAVKLTIVMDPFGDITLTPGSLPSSSVSLPNGPTTQALDNLTATFRTGPLLLDPQKIQMPTPSEIRGDWAWVARKDVTDWQPNSEVKNTVSQAELNPAPQNLIEGWLSLSNFNKRI